MNSRNKILEWLKANPGYHFGLDIAKACDISRGTIYIHLGKLEEGGQVERVDPPDKSRPVWRLKP